MSVISLSCGAVIFDAPDKYDPDYDNTGYACIAGCEPFEIRGTGDLPTDCYWWTNLTPKAASVHKLLRTPRFLNSRYLRTDQTSLLREFGISKNQPDLACSVLATIFNNTIRISQSLFKFDRLPRGSLDSGFAQLMSLEHPEQDPQFEEDCIGAVQTFTECERPHRDHKSEFVTLIVDRAAHASAILNQPLPSGRFTEVDPQAVMPRSKDRAQWLVDQDVPVLAECTINAIHPSANPLVNFGSGGGELFARGSNDYSFYNPRRFSTLPEIRVLNSFCKIDIDKIYVDTVQMMPRFKFPFELADAQLSISAGLVAENLWVALGRSPITGLFVRSSPVTAWIHAIDRMRCLALAVGARELGLDVASYGYGKIVLKVAEDDDIEQKTIIDFALSKGLVPPVGFGDGKFFDHHETPIELSDNPSAIDIRIAQGLAGNIDLLIAADTKLTEKICSPNYRPNVADNKQVKESAG